MNGRGARRPGLGCCRYVLESPGPASGMNPGRGGSRSPIPRQPPATAVPTIITEPPERTSVEVAKNPRVEIAYAG